jgi:hypothetical protein
MLMSLVVGRALLGSVQCLEWPLEKLHAALALHAGKEKAGRATEEEQFRPMRFDLAINREQFSRLCQDPDIQSGLRQAGILRAGGQFPTCHSCGGLSLKT